MMLDGEVPDLETAYGRVKDISRDRESCFSHRQEVGDEADLERTMKEGRSSLICTRSATSEQ